MITSIPPFDESWAFFLDLDGTLIELAHRPDAVTPAPRLIPILTALRQAASGAVAVVSGRGIEDVDRLLSPLRLAVAGQHGAERRDVAGRRSHVHPVDLSALRPSLAEIQARHPGLLIEDKGLSLAVHYRNAPEAAGAAEQVLRAALTRLDGSAVLQTGKSVMELRPGNIDKGMAIEAFMREPPFTGRKPVFIGDDTTDEDGFEVVRRHGGHAIKVGEGATCADFRLPDTGAVLQWLAGDGHDRIRH